MAKLSPYAKELKALMPKREYDQQALSTKELADLWGYNISTVQKMVKSRIKTGLIEQVWKRVDNRDIPAFRIKR